jgi:hypothetical protein
MTLKKEKNRKEPLTKLSQDEKKMLYDLKKKLKIC